jgi:hypothetical protein
MVKSLADMFMPEGDEPAESSGDSDSLDGDLSPALKSAAQDVADALGLKLKDEDVTALGKALKAVCQLADEDYDKGEGEQADQSGS